MSTHRFGVRRSSFARSITAWTLLALLVGALPAGAQGRPACARGMGASANAAHCRKCLPGAARSAETKPCCKMVAADVQQVATPASIQLDPPAGRDLAAPVDFDGALSGVFGRDAASLDGLSSRGESPPPLSKLPHLLRL